MRTTIWVMLFLMGYGIAHTVAQTSPVSFSQQIAPILLKQCQSCHGPGKTKGGYRLDTFDRLAAPGRSKKSPITPGQPEKSELYHLLTTADSDDRMPKDADPLPAKQVNLIKQWIEQGATFDGDSPRTALAKLIRPVDHPPAPVKYEKPVAITAMAFDSSGEHLAVGGLHEITIWNAADGQLIRRIGNVARQTYALAYTPDGKQLAAAGGQPGQSGQVRLLDADTGKLIDVLLTGDDVLLALAISPDGKILAAGGADNLLHLVDLESRKELHKINDHADWITAITFSPDGKHVATASRDRTARLFDVKTGEGHFAYREHDAPVTGVAFAGQGEEQRMFSVGMDRKLHRWRDTTEGGGNKKDKPETSSLTRDPLRLIAAGDALYVATSDAKVARINPKDRKVERTYEGQAEWVYSLAWDESHHRVAGGAHDGRVVIWNAQDGKIVSRFAAMPR